MTRFSVANTYMVFAGFGITYFGYLYFFPFDQGVSAAPFVVKAVKDVIAVLAVGWLMMHIKLSNIRLNSSGLFVPFAIATIFVSVIHATHMPWFSPIWHNIKNILLYMPFFMALFFVDKDEKQKAVEGIFQIILVLAAVQVVFEIARDFGGPASLWSPGQHSAQIYSGLIGNPNSFALLLNLAIAISLIRLLSSYKRHSITGWLALIGLFAFGIFHTISASQLIVLFFQLSYAAVLAGLRSKRMLARAFLAIGIATAAGGLDMSATTATLRPMEQTVLLVLRSPSSDEAGPPSDLSRSVSLRLTMHRETWDTLTRGLPSALLGDFTTKDYRFLDGQYLVFIVNGGLVWLIAFLVPAGLIYFRSLLALMRSRALSDPLFTLHLMLICFGITFVFSRVLQYFPFNLLFFIIAAGTVIYTETAARSVERSGSS